MKLKLKVEIKKLLCCLAFFSVLILSAEHAYATYVGLGDGSYDVTLTSVYPNTAYTGTLTILGNEATDWMFIMPSYLGGTFSGNPNEETIPPPTDLELLRGLGSFSTYELWIYYWLSGGSREWNVFTGGVSLDRGTWTAAPTNVPVPEPSTLLLLGGGLLGLVGFGRKRMKK